MEDIQQIIQRSRLQSARSQVMSDLDADGRWVAQERRESIEARDHGFLLGRTYRVDVRCAQPEFESRSCLVRPFDHAANEMAPTNPIDVADKLKAPVLGLYGGKDQGIPLDTVEKMRAALKAAGSKSDITVYPEAGHGFHADYRPSYREVDAKDAWQRMLIWFKKYGVQ